MQALRMCKSSFTSSSSLSCANMQRVSMWHHISEQTNKKWFSHGRQPVKREQRVHQFHPASHALFDLSCKVLRAHAVAVPLDMCP